MNRRDMMKSLPAILPGTTFSAISVKEADDVALVVLKVPGLIRQVQVEAIKQQWEQVTKGTRLEGVKAVILQDGMDIEVIRKRIPV